MNVIESVKQRALAVATAQTWLISIAIAVIIVIILVGVWYAAPAISKMTGRKKRDYSIDEEELDRLIDSIHKRQM